MLSLASFANSETIFVNSESAMAGADRLVFVHVLRPRLFSASADSFSAKTCQEWGKLW